MARKKKAVPFEGKETAAEEEAEHKILLKRGKGKRKARRSRRG